MDDVLKFFRDHKLAILAIAAVGYVAMFVCFRAKSAVLFDILVLVAGSLVLVAIYRYQPKGSDRAEIRKSLRRRKRRRHRTRR
jgi:hypothetical protein